MKIDRTPELTIFESPDGGKTVYARQHGQSRRELVREPVEARTVTRWANLHGAVVLAETNETLNAILCQLEMTYELVRDRNG